MNDIKSLNGVASPSIDDLMSWTVQMAESGRWPGDAPRQSRAAISALAGVLTPEEPRDAAWFFDNVDGMIAIRYAGINPGRGDTARTYASKARRAWKMFEEYRSDPLHFQVKREDRKSQPAGEAKPKGRVTPATAAPVQVPIDTGAHRFPLGNGRFIEFSLPADGILQSEATRFAYHVLTMAHDFKPAIPKPEAYESSLARVAD